MAGNNSFQVHPIIQAELETGTITRIPKLMGAEDYGTWKNRMKAFYFVNDHTQWNSVQLGPHIPTRTTDAGEVFNTDPTTYTDLDKQLMQRDNKAYGALTMALSNDVYNMFEEYGSAHDLWFALSEYYEGNAEMRQNKQDMIQKEYDMFGSVRGESLSSHIDRFMNLLTKMKKAGIPVNNRNSVTPRS